MATTRTDFGTPQDLANMDQVNNANMKMNIAQLKQECIAKGGTWNSELNTCSLAMPNTADLLKMPNQNQATPQAPPKNAAQSGTLPVSNPVPQVFNSQNTGRASGITIPGQGNYQIPSGQKGPNGETIMRPATLEEYNAWKGTQTVDGQQFGQSDQSQTFLGLGPQGVNQIAAGEQARTAIPQGTQGVGDALLQRKVLEMRLHQAAQIGQIDFQTAQEMESAGIDWKQALLSGASNIAPSAVQYAAIGAGVAAAGSAGSAAPVGGVIGGIAGAIKGFYQGVTSNIKKQKGEFISIKAGDLATRVSNIKKYISATNANPNNSDEYIQAFNMELSLIQRDYSNLHREAQKDINKWNGEDGGAELARYEIFFESTKPLLEGKMREAVQTPDLSKAYLGLEDLNVQ